VVAEVDDVGVAALRLNAAPRDGALQAFYRVGNGRAGNAEVEAINAIVWDPGAGPSGAPPAALKAIKTVRNPLPASGGVEPEDADAAKLAIPGAFLEHQQRALTADDYVSLATEVPGVRRAAARLRSNGSLTVVDVAIQPIAGEDPRSELLARVHRALEAARRIGHVVRVQPPRYRPLVIALDVALAPSAVRADVASQLARLLASGWLPDGTPALFSPTKLAFATTIYSSPVIAAVHAVAGVRSATLTRFGFLGDPAPPPGATLPASLTVGAMEIVRLDNDPAAPGNGYTVVTLEGGR
jgi:predicted phage baseplate assembly protein